MKWDVFISHASEDKEDIAIPLANVLKQHDVRVWLDKMELKPGDSLRQKIDEGLSFSRHGVVILSKHFFSKAWPQKELDALVSRESETHKVILPVWHGLTHQDVARYSPLLAGKVATNMSFGLETVASDILAVVKAVDYNEENADKFTSKPPFVTQHLKTNVQKAAELAKLRHEIQRQQEILNATEVLNGEHGFGDLSENISTEWKRVTELEQQLRKYETSEPSEVLELADIIFHSR